MSDEELIAEEAATDEEGGEAGGKKKIGFLPAIVIEILKWSAILIGAIIFIVVVVVITVRMMSTAPTPTASRLPQHSEFEQTALEELEWFGQIGDIRGSTADEVRRTFIVAPHIGYAVGSERTAQELIRREIQVHETISVYFASRSINDLQGVQNRERVKRELREQINRIMSSEAQIRDVAFTRYEFIEF